MQNFGQDMPPPGGYAPIAFERVKQKRLISSNFII